MGRIEAGGSVLDLVLDTAARLEKSVAPEDRARLDQYFQSVRDLEGRLQRSIAWENRSKPKVDFPEPKDIADANEVIEKSKLMFDLIRLALQTDSTRVVTLSLSTFSVVPHVPGVKNETQVLYGSCLGNANSHANQNLPVILAGGGFKHGRHLAFDSTNNTPLTNLFVSMPQRLGIEADRFASSTGALAGLRV
ncbi:MAG: DUF1552 domain-containing protein [Opitutus sp.]|nr:DUF1552 domain-containing protein [Opitutus sp.]